MPNALSTKADLFADFRNIDLWIFDLDNTLYPPTANIMTQMRDRTYAYICDVLKTDPATAAELYERFEDVHGTALNGMMIEHQTDPKHFLAYVHDVDRELVMPDLQLTETIRSLPGRRIIYTNGTVSHAGKVLKRLGMTDLFEDVFDIVWADLRPKAHLAPYEKLFAQMGVDPTRAAMFEDSAKNLEAPFALGTKTILVRPQNVSGGMSGHLPGEHSGFGHVNYLTHDIEGFLSGILEEFRDRD